MSDRIINRFQKDRFYEIVGQTITGAREEHGLGTSALAERAGLALSTIQNAETGATCSLLVITKIAHALDTTIDALVPLEALG